MRCNRFCFTGPLQHEELGQDSDRLEPDGECPHDLHNSLASYRALRFVATHFRQCVLVREQHRQYCAEGQQVLYFECVKVRVVGRLEVVEHEVYGIRGCADEDDLEDGVVQRMGVVEGPEKVDVSTKVNNQVQELRLERNAGRALFSNVRFRVFCSLSRLDVHWRSSSCARESGSIADGTSPLKNPC